MGEPFNVLVLSAGNSERSIRTETAFNDPGRRRTEIGATIA